MLPAKVDIGWSKRERVSLALLLLGTFLLSAGWAFATPIPTFANGALWGNFHPDEFSHASVIRYMATRHELPPYAFPYDTSVHPPLYHGLAALVYAVLAPTFGDIAALLAIRLLTAICGVGIAYLTVQATRHVASTQTALLAGALVALIPMRVAIGGSLSNENLAALGAAGALATIVGSLTGAGGFTPRRLTTLAFWLVVGIGSKVTCLGLLPASAIALFAAARPPIGRRLTQAGSQLLAMLTVVGAAWGAYFARNARLYGDPFRRAAADRLWAGLQPGFAEISARQHVGAARYALALSAVGWRSFWGYFDGFHRPMPVGVYLVLFLFQTATIVGLWRVWRRPTGDGAKPSAALMATFAAYALTVAGVFFTFNWSHFTPQGRYFFVLLLPFGMLTAIGWRAVIGGLSKSTRKAASTLLIALLIVLNLYLLRVIPGRLSMPGVPMYRLAASADGVRP